MRNKVLCIAASLAMLTAFAGAYSDWRSRRTIASYFVHRPAISAPAISHEDPEICLAAANGSLGELDIALQHGYSVDARAKGGLTPLFFATAFNHPEAVRLLLRRGANASAEDDGGATSLHWAAEAGSDKIVAALHAKGAPVNKMTQSGETALGIASMKGHTSVVALLLDAGATQGTKDWTGRTALEWAKTNKHADIAGMLMRAQWRNVLADPRPPPSN